MEKKFWFKIAMDSHSNEFPVNLNWTITEFIINMKPVLIDYFIRKLPDSTHDIDILDNISNNEQPENLRHSILPDDTIKLFEKYNINNNINNINNINNLAFYIRPSCNNTCK